MASVIVKDQTGPPVFGLQEMETTYNVCRQACREETSSLFLPHLCGLTLSSQSYPQTLGSCLTLSEYSVRQKDYMRLKSKIDDVNKVQWISDSNPHYPANKSYNIGNVRDVDKEGCTPGYSRTTKRLAREMMEINGDYENLKNVSFFFNDNNMQEMVFYFNSNGFNNSESDYQGGGYFVRVIFPDKYPFGESGPKFFMLTPNGRFFSESEGNNDVNRHGICLPYIHNPGRHGGDDGYKPGTWVGETMIPQFFNRFVFPDGQSEVGEYEPIKHSLDDIQLERALSLKRRQLAMDSHAFNHELLKRDDMKFVRDSIEAHVENNKDGDDEKPEHFARCCHLMSVIDGSGVQETGTIEKLADLIIQVKKHEKEELEQQAQKLEEQLRESVLNTQPTDKVELQLSLVYCSLASLYIDGCFTSDKPTKIIVKKDINKAVKYYLKASKLDTNDGGFSDYMIAKIEDVYEKLLIKKGSTGDEIHKNSEKRLLHLRRAERKKHEGAIFMLERMGESLNKDVSVNNKDYYLGKILFKEYQQLLKDDCCVKQCNTAKKNAKEKLERYVKACTQVSNNSVRYGKNYREVKAREYLLEIMSDDYIKDNKVSVSSMKKFVVFLKEFLLDNPFSGKVSSILCCMTTAIQTSQHDQDDSKYKKEEKAAIAIARANGIYKHSLS